MSRNGRGMKPIPYEIIPKVIIPKLGIPKPVYSWRAYGSVTVKGLHISGTYCQQFFTSAYLVHSVYYGKFSRTWSPVRLAHECGWVLPLKASTPAGIVADYLFEEGQEETNMWRLLMWFHNLGSDGHA